MRTPLIFWRCKVDCAMTVDHIFRNAIAAPLREAKEGHTSLHADPCPAPCCTTEGCGHIVHVWRLPCGYTVPIGTSEQWDACLTSLSNTVPILSAICMGKMTSRALAGGDGQPLAIKSGALQGRFFRQDVRTSEERGTFPRWQNSHQPSYLRACLAIPRGPPASVGDWRQIMLGKFSEITSMCLIPTGIPQLLCECSS